MTYICMYVCMYIYICKMALLGFKSYMFQALLPEGGSQPLKWVGGKITYIFYVYFICENCWF